MGFRLLRKGPIKWIEAGPGHQGVKAGERQGPVCGQIQGKQEIPDHDVVYGLKKI